jgi:hypothetical protein
MDLESTDKEENIAYSYEIAERTPQKHFKVMFCQFSKTKTSTTRMNAVVML